MKQRSDQARVFVVSCRLSDAEMEMLQTMTMEAGCSISDILRHGIGYLSRNPRGTSGLSSIAINRMEKTARKLHPKAEKKISENKIPYRLSITME